MAAGTLTLRPTVRRRRLFVNATASAIVSAFAHSRGNSAHSTRAHVSASASARCAISTSIPSASARTLNPRRFCSGNNLRASAAVHRTGGFGHSSPISSNPRRSTRRSNGALWATSTRPSRRSAIPGSTSSRPGALASISWVIPVKRWMPRPSGRLQRTSDENRSCSSPPPTSTAPTSVSSHASPPRPLVSVSTTRNSAVAVACSSSVTRRVIRPASDGKQAGLQAAWTYWSG